MSATLSTRNGDAHLYKRPQGSTSRRHENPTPPHRTSAEPQATMAGKRQKILEFFERHHGRRLRNQLLRVFKTLNIGLAALPPEIAVQVILYADTDTLLTLRRTCKAFRDLVQEEVVARCRKTVVPPQVTYDAMIIANQHDNRRSSRYLWHENPVSQPLARLVAQGRYDAVRFCLEDAGLDANLYDLSARPLLHIAAFYAQVPVARLLLQRGADIFATARVNRNTALDFAVCPELSHDEFGPPLGYGIRSFALDAMVRLLLSEGARYATNAGPGALPYLCRMPDYINLLRQAYDNGTYLSDEAIARQLLLCDLMPGLVPPVVAALPEALGPVIVTASGRSAIEAALSLGHMELALALINCGFPLNLGLNEDQYQYPELSYPLDNLQRNNFLTHVWDRQVVMALLARPQLQAAGFGQWIIQTGRLEHLILDEPLNYQIRTRNWPMVNQMLRMGWGNPAGYAEELS
ncbi:uncharacterized protein BO72DRAFT_301637 [Aspergillus fijiensis CBS 313.89]|uniref:F-box domain-containing protein n=1 Tax=Aspergillus fijiensis CBS 313.89 TaxID=1448319 RepID=A0A8G1W1E0_9EURO|nr:uncharacterized protein BO72DRAFT_301637 [Aspergillus fijiensis CBS 313.89]RAK80312.1 hypothetical protein BO72DRAFT_301637 [Aspergillus fijiensis CBS 313.89]